MRINSANIHASVYKSNRATTSPVADREVPKHPSNVVRDNYHNNNSPQIIEAEYVDSYNPNNNLFNKERSTLDNTLDQNILSFELSEGSNSSGNAPTVKKYQLISHEAPPPGSIIDTFA